MDRDAHGFERSPVSPDRILMDCAADNQVACPQVGDVFGFVDAIAEQRGAGLAWVVIDKPGDMGLGVLEHAGDVFGVLPGAKDQHGFAFERTQAVFHAIGGILGG